MPNYAPRLSIPFVDCSGVVKKWSEACKAMVVYQHDADKDVSRVHLHMVMIDCKYATPEALKRQFREMIVTERKGNELWAWSRATEPDLSFIIYMSNGCLTPVFVKNVLAEDIENYRSLWVEPKKSDSTSEKKEATKTKNELLYEMSEIFNKMKFDHYAEEFIWKSAVQVVLKVLKKNKIVIGRYKIREYRDALLYHREDIEEKFMDFVNEDFKSWLKYNG